jgi:hypothetical protein
VMVTFDVHVAKLRVTGTRRPVFAQVRKLSNRFLFT